MIINHNLNAMNAHRNLTFNNIQQGKSSEKLSSGYRINRAADDAAGLSISEKMRSQIRSLGQAQRNSMDGVSLVQTAEGALTEVSDMLVRMKELATQSANGTYTNLEDRAAMDKEYQALKTAMSSVETSAKFNGKKLLDGTMGTVNIQIGDTGADVADIDMSTMKLADVTTKLIGITTDVLAKTELDEIDKQINVVNGWRSDLGAFQNQLEHTFNNIGTTTENLQAAESRIRDTDMAKEMMSYTKFNILQQASTAMLAQANQAPQGVLQLLR